MGRSKALLGGSIVAVVVLSAKEPATLKKDVKRFEAAANAAVVHIESDPSVLLNEKSDPFAKANKVARRLGLKVCAADG